MDTVTRFRQAILARTKNHINRNYGITRCAEGGYRLSRKINVERVMKKVNQLSSRRNGIQIQLDLFTGRPIRSMPNMSKPIQLTLFNNDNSVTIPPRPYQPMFIHFKIGGGSWSMRRA